MEGKELRFGIGSSSLFAVVTTVASCGAVNAAMESLTGLGGAIPMANMMTGEVIFGGVGSGLYGMLLFVLLAVFLAGLMVGRTPEYLGKKIGAREVKLVALGTLAVPLARARPHRRSRSRPTTASASIFDAGPAGLQRDALRVHLAGQQQRLGVRRLHRLPPAQRHERRRGDRDVRDLLGGLAMLVGRFVPLLRRARRRRRAGRPQDGAPPGPGTMRTDTPTFVVLLIATVLLVALLTFVPALLLGPVAQALTDRLF